MAWHISINGAKPKDCYRREPLINPNVNPMRHTADYFWLLKRLTDIVNAGEGKKYLLKKPRMAYLFSGNKEIGYIVSIVSKDMEVRFHCRNREGQDEYLTLSLYRFSEQKTLNEHYRFRDEKFRHSNDEHYFKEPKPKVDYWRFKNPYNVRLAPIVLRK